MPYGDINIDLLSDAIEKELEEHRVWDPDGENFFTSRFAENYNETKKENTHNEI